MDDAAGQARRVVDSIAMGVDVYANLSALGFDPALQPSYDIAEN